MFITRVGRPHQLDLMCYDADDPMQKTHGHGYVILPSVQLVTAQVLPRPNSQARFAFDCTCPTA